MQAVSSPSRSRRSPSAPAVTSTRPPGDLHALGGADQSLGGRSPGPAGRHAGLGLAGPRWPDRDDRRRLLDPRWYARRPPTWSSCSRRSPKTRTPLIAAIKGAAAQCGQVGRPRRRSPTSSGATSSSARRRHRGAARRPAAEFTTPGTPTERTEAFIRHLRTFFDVTAAPAVGPAVPLIGRACRAGALGVRRVRRVHRGLSDAFGRRAVHLRDAARSGSGHRGSGRRLPRGPRRPGVAARSREDIGSALYGR